MPLMTKFHNRESTGDSGQINHLPRKIQFSDSHDGTFCLQFFFFCHLSETINPADSLVSGPQDSHSRGGVKMADEEDAGFASPHN